MKPTSMLWWLGVAALGGCAGTARVADVGAGVFSPQGPRIVLDGRVDDWPEGAAVVSDESYLYFRVKLEGQEQTLQALPGTLALLVDADGSASTGWSPERPGVASSLGVDLSVEFSPRGPDGTVGRGAVVYAAGGDGARRAVGQAESGIALLPTHGSDWYEFRIRRDIAGVPGLAGTGTARGLFVLTDPAGEVEGWSDPFAVRLAGPARAPGLGEATIPPRPSRAVRVMSLNVFRDSPQSKGEVFGRLIQAVDPDVVLFQEWTHGGVEDVLGWMRMYVGGESRWRVIRGDGAGVVIASRHPIAPLGPGRLMAAGSDRPVRMVSATVYTPIGQMAVANVHLKCCGSVGSEEDARRVAEAEAINAALREALSEASVPARVIAGDMNLVGSRLPVEVLGVGLDRDGSSLEEVAAPVLGEGSWVTWRDEGSAFVPGRLDYVLVGESGAEVLGAFTLDTGVLTDRALARMGLDRGDSRVSDHLAVVVDLRPR